MQAIKLSKSSVAVPDIADFFEVAQRAVFKWLAAFASGGQNALLAGDTGGRPPKIRPEQLQWIAKTVKDNTPNQLQFQFGLWTIKLITVLIERQFNIALSAPTVSKIVKQLGFSVQRPLYRAYEQTAVLVKSWQETDYPALRERAKQCGAVIMYADEAGLRSDYHTGTTWGKVGQTPIVRTTGQRFSIQMLSAIGTDGQFEFMLHEGGVNSEVFIKFLTQLLMGATKPIFLIVNGSSIHKSKLVKEFLEQNKGKIELHFIPPYSPELNPDEQVWKNVKAEVVKQKIVCRESLWRLAKNALMRLKETPSIVMGFCRHPEVAR